MRRSYIFSFIFIPALFLAMAALLLPAARVNAAGTNQTAADCLACHPRSFTGEVHGLGTNNPIFKDAWDGQGNPKECLTCHVTGYDAATGTWKADTISCEACHSPIPTDHPDQKMPVDKSNQLCAKCHNDTRFGWADWKTSVHYQQNMSCSDCHDPHLPKRAPGEDASVVCQKCHKDVIDRSQHSIHAKKGVTCIQCHLGPKKGVDDFHKVPDHSFKPVLETCNGCHAQDMHDAGPTEVVTPTQTPTVIAPTPTVLPVVTLTPQAPANVVNITPFTTLDFTFIGVGLLGLGAVGGLALSPLFDQVNHFLSKVKK